ncbi:alkyl hydroperoxide reductase subunit F [Pseudemcibacter aquimaris]|uniref:alkyl hydroperoxide reductase subunit F n=1 Tax=Pseudemcibacter aquimaris TaxID=2857064 RepID=UPI00201138EB|nr:alkyl hydroperoxide reductase subunit F [Pseudemcibacter aquimaris]MCC3862553.1 alkyl hydroperoxide reductase subunit F [Pseudemcibacter aquimaris]WDU57928.1 alkyl hydroperoxide reductase subunit F [Pseudemcibacter aquimaris]
MLTNEILNSLKQYTANMQNQITLVLETGEHEKRAELHDFLTKLSSVSENIKFEERDTGGRLRSPICFLIEADGKDTGIRFSGLPGGHEFNSLVLAILHSSGTDMKLDDSILKIISNINEELNFQVYVSLSCHNCPDVVQTLNKFALINDKISTETIDGGVFPELIEENNIQGVPSVYLNGEVFANGKIDPAVLMDKLLQRNPEAINVSDDEKLPLQDMTIIGGGPAGVSAAIYGARKGLAITIIADRFGGQVKDTMGIENLISVSKTTGPELTGALMAHMDDYTITRKEHLRVDRIEPGKIKKVHLSSGEVIETKTVIIATGAKWRELGIPGEKENIGNGVAYCPHCDGPFYKGKDVAVIGGGNSGIEAAIDLSGIVNSVSVFEFLPELKADQVLIEQAESRDNITIYKNVAAQEILANGSGVEAIQYQDRESGDVLTKDLNGVFVQIGLLPNSEFVKGLVDQSEYGEILINERGETSEEGIFACGDVTTVPYKQIVIAMGEGSKASLSAFDYLIREF